MGLGGNGEKYILVLSGDDPLALSTAARQVEKDLRIIPGLGGIASSAALVRPEIAVRPDFARAADLGTGPAKKSGNSCERYRILIICSGAGRISLH